MRWFFASLLLMSVAFAQSPPKLLEQPKAPEQPATKDDRGTEKTPLVVKVIPTPKTESETAKETQDRIQKADTDTWIERWTGAVALFTLILAGVGAWQGIQLKRSVDLARDEFNVTHRPKIIVRAFQISKLEPEHTVGVLFIGQNAGDSAAKVIEVRSGTIVLDQDQKLPNDLSFRFKESFDVELKSGEKELFPANGGAVISENSVVRVRNGISVLYVLGTLTYLDGSKTKRETGFCRRYVPAEDRWEPVESEYEYAY